MVMTISTLLNQIYHLPVHERMLIVECTIRSIRTENNQLENAAILMADEYSNNKELTAFTQLDIENFYETR
ncbi:MAG: hypothetical protein LBC40_01970 [Dysgonamonadaceae bacterium]|jgi:hypothetical protein|nr:hypothetical protein [Dysgonamonadaceae bacterium]